MDALKNLHLVALAVDVVNNAVAMKALVVGGEHLRHGSPVECHCAPRSEH